MKIKYPSTPYFIQQEHLPLLEGKEIVVTEKRDGENNKFYPSSTELHARSIDSGCREEWRSYAKSLLSSKLYKLSEYIDRYFDLAISFENLYARHSIAYSDLLCPIELFGVWDANTLLEWDVVEDISSIIDIPTVPVLYKGECTKEVLNLIHKSMKFNKQEGYVIRLANSFNLEDFSTSIFKVVRPNHIQTDISWHKTWIKNTWSNNEI